MKNIISMNEIKDNLTFKSQVVLLMAAVCLAFYLFGIVQFFMHGHEGYNLTRQHPWGLLLVVYEFFVALAMGLGMIGATALIFDLKTIKPYAMKAILFGFVSLCAGFGVFLFEIGHPIRMVIYTALSGNVTSPLFWLGVFYPSFLGFSVLTLFFAYKKSAQGVKLAAIGTLLASIASILTAGSIFGLLYAIPFSSGTFYPIQFILTAILAAILTIAFVFWVSGSHDESKKAAVETLGRFGGIIIAILLIMYLSRYFSALYSSIYEFKASVLAMYSSQAFLIFELFLGLILPLSVILFFKENLATMLAVIAIPALFGIMMSRYNLVEGLQFIPKKDVQTMTYEQAIVPAFDYLPSMAEISLSLGGLGLCIVLYFVGSVVWNGLTNQK